MKELIETHQHRPWGLPNERWKFYQEWNRAVFLHWEVDLKELQKLVPDGLDIDLYKGKAWVSLVAFTMEKIRPRNLPQIPPISNFHEINIRTYIKSGEKTGVYFLSIEGAKKLSCALAKGISELPYRFSKMTRNEGFFKSQNKPFGDRFSIEFNVGMHKEKNDFENWLTERYALFQDSPKGINAFEIHHLEWPIQELSIAKLNVQYDRFSHLIGGKPDCVHYSEGVKVLAFGKKKMNP